MKTSNFGNKKHGFLFAQDVIDSVHKIIEEKPDILLCTKPNCEPYTEARENFQSYDVDECGISLHTKG